MAFSYAVWFISLGLSVLSTVVSCRRKLWNRHLNLVLSLLLAAALLLCVFYQPLLYLIRDCAGEELFVRMRTVLRVLLFARNGIHAALETLCLILSLCAVFATLATACSVLEGEKQRGWAQVAECRCAFRFEAAGKNNTVIYIKNCSLIL